MKEFQGNEKLHLTPRFWCPARLDAETTKAVQTIALKSARVIGCRDIARADIRLSSDGIPYVLEVNPLPGLDPEESNLPLMAKPAGMSYEGMIQRLIHLAIERSISSHSLSTHNHFPSADTPRSRELPDSMEKESGLSGTPAIPAKRTNGQGSDGRTSDPKEQPHGR